MLGQVYTVGWVYPAFGTVFLEDNNFHFDPTLCTPVAMVHDIAEPPETRATVQTDNPEMASPPEQQPNTGTDLGMGSLLHITLLPYHLITYNLTYHLAFFWGGGNQGPWCNIPG